jgi:sugar phosphate isomerase/epimerase
MPSSDPLSRRRFLALASLVPAVALAPSLLRAAVAGQPAGGAKPAARKVPIGLELYAVRKELAGDLPGTLEQVAGMGYEAVEFYAPYFEWTPAKAKEVRAQLDQLGLKCLSTHNHIAAFTPGEGIAKAIELNGILGARHIVMASAPGGTKGVDGWKRLSETLTTAVEQFQPHGLTAGFHNHQAEWAKLEGGRRILDVIAENTPPAFVLQLDVGTCMEVGENPVAWIRSHPGRIRNVHLKDWAPGTEAEEKRFRVLFGEGISPWPAIIEAAESVGGVEVYLMEQEGSRFSELESAKRCLASWRQLRAQT